MKRLSRKRKDVILIALECVYNMVENKHVTHQLENEITKDRMDIIHEYMKKKNIDIKKKAQSILENHVNL